MLGSMLSETSVRMANIAVEFSYRQMDPQTEENLNGADGGFLVRVRTPEGVVEKSALFQAKIFHATGPVRDLSLTPEDAARLETQVRKMLRHTADAVVLFYTPFEMYVVNARRYLTSAGKEERRPLSSRYRLVTLSTYLGKWLPRCTKGDLAQDLRTRIEHRKGFTRHAISMDVVSKQPRIAWPESPTDPDEERWEGRSKRQR